MMIKPKVKCNDKLHSLQYVGRGMYVKVAKASK